MKILIGKFILEANENIPMISTLENVDLQFGEAVVDLMQLRDIFNKEGVTVIPTLSANAGSTGVMDRKSFDFIENTIIEGIEDNIKDLDGIFLHLHGASKVVGLGSGEHHILDRIRKIVGPYLPIAIVADPHGNLSKEYVENTTLIRSYRESPHTDIQETVDFLAKNLISIIRNRENIKPVYRKLPLILGGEQSVSTDEPVRSINAYMDALEKDTRIRSASWHVGYIRHDTHLAGCGVIVIPEKEIDTAYANEVADDLANYVWLKRHEFHYTGLTAKPDEALKMALEHNEGVVFLTDSGDNVSSGSMGVNTFVLKQVLDSETDKRILFASIHDKNSYSKLNGHVIGDIVPINLGINNDELSSPVSLDVEIKHMGSMTGMEIFGEFGGYYGDCITVSVVNRNIDIIVANTNQPFVERHQFEAAGVDWDDYDLVVVKIGYAFPELKEHGSMCIMSLTQGATLQDTASLPFKLIMRPMFPIDKI